MVFQTSATVTLGTPEFLLVQKALANLEQMLSVFSVGKEFDRDALVKLEVEKFAHTSSSMFSVQVLIRFISPQTGSLAVRVFHCSPTDGEVDAIVFLEGKREPVGATEISNTLFGTTVIN